MARDFDIDPLFGEQAEIGIGQMADGVMFADYSPANLPYNFSSSSLQQTRSSSSFNSDLQTVSPQEIMHDDLMSAPNSAAFTTMASPSWETPVLSTETSPAFGVDSDFQGSANWSPLFASEGPSIPHSKPRLASVSHKRKSSARTVSGSPASPDFADSDLWVGNETTQRNTVNSNSVGVNKRRGKPLKPIKLEESTDITDFKRRRNTLAARKSRAKRAETMDAQKDEIDRLTEENVRLEEEAAVSARESEFWKQKYLERCDDGA